MQIIKTAALITKAINSIAGRGAKLDHDIHVAGVSVLAHASEHGDTTLCDKLVQAMPKGGRKLALVEWMLAYGQIAKLDPKLDKDAIAAGRLFKLDRSRTYNEVGAVEKSWTEFKPEAAVTSLLARLNKAAKDGLTIEGRAEALAKAQELIAALSAEPVKFEPAPV